MYETNEEYFKTIKQIAACICAFMLSIYLIGYELSNRTKFIVKPEPKATEEWNYIPEIETAKAQYVMLVTETTTDTTEYKIESEPPMTTEPEIDPITEPPTELPTKGIEMLTKDAGDIPREIGSRILNETVKEKEPEARYSLTDEEKNMLCFVADSEDNKSSSSRQAVMQVILNRTQSAKFPNTIKEVLYAPKQFQTIKKYSAAYEPSAEALQALEQLLYGEDIFNEEQALYFSAPRVKPQKIAKGLYFISSFGNYYYGQN